MLVFNVTMIFKMPGKSPRLLTFAFIYNLLSVQTSNDKILNYLKMCIKKSFNFVSS